MWTSPEKLESNDLHIGVVNQVVFESLWGEVTQSTVSSFSVIEDLDVLKE